MRLIDRLGTHSSSWSQSCLDHRRSHLGSLQKNALAYFHHICCGQYNYVGDLQTWIRTQVLQDVRREGGRLPPGEEEDGEASDRLAAATDLASDETRSSPSAGKLRQRLYLPVRHRRLHHALVRKQRPPGAKAHLVTAR